MENESHKHIHDENCNHGYSPPTIIASSIIAAAVIIALSIFYNTKLILNNSGNSGGLVALQGNSAKGAAVPNQPSVPSQPTGPVKVNERKSAPVLGKSDAKVTIVEFSDFQCPFCKQFIDQTFAQIKAHILIPVKLNWYSGISHCPFTQMPKGPLWPRSVQTNKGNFGSIMIYCLKRQSRWYRFSD